MPPNVSIHVCQAWYVLISLLCSFLLLVHPSSLVAVAAPELAARLSAGNVIGRLIRIATQASASRFVD
jgi:hypothetical protein